MILSAATHNFGRVPLKLLLLLAYLLPCLVALSSRRSITEAGDFIADSAWWELSEPKHESRFSPWSQHLAPGRGICSRGWLRGMQEASQRECQSFCEGSGGCKYYCHGGKGAPKGSCLLYTECPSLFEFRGGEDVSMYLCYVKAEETTRAPSLSSAALPLQLKGDSRSAQTWQQHLAPARGYCSSGFLQLKKQESQLQCQGACNERDDCQFYCHAGLSCLQYAECPSIRDKHAGKDLTMYACYKKPPTIPGSSDTLKIRSRLSATQKDLSINTSQTKSSRPNAGGAKLLPAVRGGSKLWVSHLAPAQGICSSGYLQGAQMTSQVGCQSLCNEQRDCQYFCHGQSASRDFSCLMYSECPSLRNTTRNGNDVSGYGCYRKGTSDDASLPRLQDPKPDAGVAAPKTVNTAPEATTAAWTQHLAPARGHCSAGFLQGRKDVSQIQCQGSCKDVKDCQFYCFGGTTCLLYTECPSLWGERKGKDLSMFTCYRDPNSTLTAGVDNGTERTLTARPPQEHLRPLLEVKALAENVTSNASNQTHENHAASLSEATNANRICGILWLYEIPGCGDLGDWVQRLQTNHEVDEIITLQGPGEGLRVDGPAYMAFHRKHLKPVLESPKGKLVVVRHGPWGPAPSGWLNKTWELMQNRLKANGCELVRATFLRDPVDRIHAIADAFPTNDTESDSGLEGLTKTDKTFDNGITRYLLNNNKGSAPPRFANARHEREAFSMVLGGVNSTGLHRALSVLRTFEFVGVAEELLSEVARLEARLGLPHDPIAEEVGLPLKMTRRRPDALRAQLAARLHADASLYDEARRRSRPQNTSEPFTERGHAET